MPRPCLTTPRLRRSLLSCRLYNERENIIAAVEAIDAAFTSHDLSWEVLVVDDDSPDRTWEVVEHLGDRRVRCYRRLDRKGLSSAIVDGLSLGQGERLVVADADLQHDLSQIPDLVKALDCHPLALGTRYAAGGGATGWSKTSSDLLARRHRSLPVGARHPLQRPHERVLRHPPLGIPGTGPQTESAWVQTADGITVCLAP